MDITVSGSGNLRLSDLDVDRTIRVAKQQPSTNVSIHLEGSVQGELALVQPSARMTVSADKECTATVALNDGSLRVGDEGLGQAVVNAIGGSLAGGVYGEIRLGDKGRLTLGDGAILKIERLIVIGSAELAVGKGQALELGVVCGDGNQRQPVLSIVRAGNTGGRAVKVRRVTAATIDADSSTAMQLQIQDAAEHVTLRGAVFTAFSGTAVASDVEFASKDEQHPRLAALPGAVITGVTGEFVLGQIGGAHLAGGPAGFLINSVAPRPKGAESACADAFVSGFMVPGGLEGRSLLNEFDDAHHLEPSTKDLPGWDRRLLRGLPWQRRPKTTRPVRNQVQLRHDAELMRKMRELARSKGASGSTRTKVGWCAQRLRHLTTHGRTERFALGAYRLLGYGERPLPPFVTWLVLSLVLAPVPALVAHEYVFVWPVDFGHALRLAGWFLEDIGKAWIDRAFSPVGAIFGTGSSDESASWLYVLRALVAIPLVVFSLSLRNYVRSGR
ncbi:hypothetical protein [Promicromonospora sp. NFX87]|uniref:hypothetical protein n=1 Tax=Promicromonospora sp. NFX87 TaxID=3402691 RepID=UPI003AFA3B68